MHKDPTEDSKSLLAFELGIMLFGELFFSFRAVGLCPFLLLHEDQVRPDPFRPDLKVDVDRMTGQSWLFLAAAQMEIKKPFILSSMRLPLLDTNDKVKVGLAWSIVGIDQAVWLVTSSQQKRGQSAVGSYPSSL